MIFSEIWGKSYNFILENLECECESGSNLSIYGFFLNKGGSKYRIRIGYVSF